MKLVESEASNNSGVVIGTYSGKSCDADVLNNNVMYLSRELFTKLIDSEEYATAIKLGWYIGYLGHPKDPNCMDFRNACIVMREMHMDDNGDVFATFDLLDTPVGKVVKTFIDAGVQFGISIRGAGDVAQDGTVDPDTFVFRGYDLVTFPAYNDAIPEFTDVAAATNTKAQQQYKKISSAINSNLPSITSCEAIEILQQHLNPVSEEYSALANREAELAEQEADVDISEYVNVLEQKLEAMTKLYLEQFNSNAKLAKEVDTAAADLLDARYAVQSASQLEARKISSIRRILEDQIAVVSSSLDSAQRKISLLRKTNARLKTAVTASEEKCASAITANKKLTKTNQAIEKELKQTKETLSHEVDKNNLIYRRKIEASTQTLQANEAKISELDEKVRKTVAENSKLSEKLSNRDNEVKKLKEAIAASNQMILSYQQAYADTCADIIGIHVDNIDVTASTRPEELRKMIFGASSYNSSNQAQLEPVEFDATLDLDNMVTL